MEKFSTYGAACECIGGAEKELLKKFADGDVRVRSNSEGVGMLAPTMERMPADVNAVMKMFKQLVNKVANDSEEHQDVATLREGLLSCASSFLSAGAKCSLWMDAIEHYEKCRCHCEGNGSSKCEKVRELINELIGLINE